MARRRFARRGGRRRSVRRWTAQVGNIAQTIGTNFVNFDIVAPADYRQQVTLEPSGVSLVRIRGFISGSFSTVAAAGLTAPDVWGFIGVWDADLPLNSTTQSAATAQNAIDEDILWWRTASRVLVPGTPSHPVEWDIDIKARRRLKDNVVRLSLIFGFNNADEAFTGSFNLRSLIVGG